MLHYVCGADKTFFRNTESIASEFVGISGNVVSQSMVCEHAWMLVPQTWPGTKY